MRKQCTSMFMNFIYNILMMIRLLILVCNITIHSILHYYLHDTSEIRRSILVIIPMISSTHSCTLIYTFMHEWFCIICSDVSTT